MNNNNIKKQKDREYSLRYYYHNRNKILTQTRERFKIPEIHEKILNRNRIWQAKNQNKINAWSQKYHQRPEVKMQHRQSRKRYLDKVKASLLQAYGNKCACCGETRQEFLTIDHVNGSGTKHRKSVSYALRIHLDIIKQGFPRDKYRILCMNCNMATKYGKPCPHEVERMKSKIIARN